MIPRNRDISHAAYQELLGAYALDAVEADERRSLEAHLASCPSCPAELARLQSAIDAYPLALTDLLPSAALRGRIELAIGVGSAHSTWTNARPPAPPPVAQRATPSHPPPPSPTPIRPSAIYPWVAAAALLLAVSLGLLAWNLQLRTDPGQPTEVETVALRPTDPDQAVDGDLTYLTDRGVAMLTVRDLPPLESGELYQVWLIGDGGDPEPVGTFDASSANFAVVVDRDRYQVLALTIEPGPLGSPQPTSDPIADAPLSSA